MASGWQDGMVVLCAANGFDEPGMADRHMAEHLSRLVPVLYVDPPVSRLRRRDAPGSPRLRMIRESLARLTPSVLPFPARRGMTGITAGILRHYLRRATARLGGKVDAVISAWPHFPVLGACGEDVSVYWAQDDYAGGAELLGLNARLLERQERKTASGADLVVTSGPVVQETWRDRGLDPVLIPFGADVDAFADTDSAPLPADVSLRGPIAGFAGRINDRTELALLEAIASRGRPLLLVGPHDPRFEPQRFAVLCRLRNVCHVGPKPAAALPGYLRLMDAGLVPYRDSPFNRGSFPLKTLEYLAAGRAVVSTPLPASRWLGTGLITIADGPGPFADAVDQALDEPRTPELVTARQAFAEQLSWRRRAAEMRAAIVARRGNGLKR